MSVGINIVGHRVSRKVIAAMAGVIMLAALLPALSNTPRRDVVLVAKGMAFYLENDLKTPNPTIEVKAGERVRVVVRNQDPGMTHDFAVPILGAVMKEITWNQTGQVVFNAPEKRGTYEYVCQPHRLMMKGTIRVY
jgi:plastocyanin